MFVEDSRELDLRRLTFLRWLVEHDRLEHPAIGPSSGDLAGGPVAGAIVELPLTS